MIDIVTVVFREELPILKLQAESIDLYCNNMDLGNIYVIINDEDLDTAEIDHSWWGKFSNRVIVIHRRVWNIEYAENGWLTQQLLKLLGSTVSQNKWNMILDAKTILIQSVDLNKIFDQGKLTWGYFPIFPVFDPAKKIVSNLFGIDQHNVAGPAGIPFFFDNSTVRNMIAEVEQRTNESFAKWFQETGMVTEFILYSGYIEYRDGSLDKMYVHSNKAYRPCNICHNEVQIFDSKYQEMQQPNILTVSVHRNAWTKLTESQKQTYQEFLLSAGITRAKELI